MINIILDKGFNNESESKINKKSIRVSSSFNLNFYRLS